MVYKIALLICASFKCNSQLNSLYKYLYKIISVREEYAHDYVFICLFNILEAIFNICDYKKVSNIRIIITIVPIYLSIQ